ncbi:MAG: sialidase family protein [Pirellulaceae bacterium]|nr:exo-alpha-sialidase [Planctomycetales bacterium]
MEISKSARWTSICCVGVVGFVAATIGPSVMADDEAVPQVVKNTVVFREAGRFAGWPANNGIWIWENEILVGYILGYHEEREGHTIAPGRPQVTHMARSGDGGETWAAESPPFAKEGMEDVNWSKLNQPLDFTVPNFAARFREDRCYFSLDRGHKWQGPYEIPKYGRPGLLARTDYIVEGPQRLTAFISAEKDGGNEGQPLCIRTEDGGQSWNLVGWIGSQPPAGYGYAIMPATVAIDGGGYLSMIRRGGVFDGRRRWWVEPYLSPDAGRSWYLLEGPVLENSGNPATLTRLKDGRLALVYGWRLPPYGIRGRISSDNGQSWSDEFILRDDGSGWDLGYPRTVERPDGKLVTVYYFRDHQRVERYIAATIWQP